MPRKQIPIVAECLTCGACLRDTFHTGNGRLPVTPARAESCLAAGHEVKPVEVRQ